MKIQNWTPKTSINLIPLGVVCGALLLWTFGCGAPGHDDHAAGHGTMSTDESERIAINGANAEDSTLLTADELRELLPYYLRVSKALANDDHHEAQMAFHEYMESVEAPSGKIGEALEALHTAPNIERAREAFHTVSRLLINAVHAHGAPQDSLYEAHCSMAFGNQGASWLQTGNAILNPYFGAMMLRCGTIEREYAALNAPVNQDGHAHH